MNSILKKYMRAFLLLPICAIYLTACDDMTEQPNIRLTITEKTPNYLVNLSIENPGGESMEIGAGAFSEDSWAPRSLSIRIKDESGNVILHQGDDPEGWWNAHYVRSELVSYPTKTRRLEAGDKMRDDFEVQVLTRGLRPRLPISGETCQFQVRVVVEYGANGRNTISSLSDWTKIVCAELFD